MNVTAKHMQSTDMITALVHEIKNPAALALAHIELARLHLDELNDIETHLSHIENALTDISELAQEMLHAEHDNTPSYEIDIHALLGDMLEAHQVARPDICFTLTPSERKPMLFHGQAQCIRIIISNLLKNAVEAVSDVSYPGHIVVITEQCETHSKISIYDNGQPKGNKLHSNGLGLKICQQLAAKMNGTVHINIGKNGGCVAEVNLPTHF